MEQIKKGRVKLLRRRPVGRSLEICFLCHRSTLNYTNLQMAFNEEWNGKRSSFCTGILAVIPDPIHTRISTTILPTFCIFIFGKMELEAPYFWSLPQTPNFLSFWVLRFRSRVLRFRVLGASFSRFRCLRFRSRVLRFRDLGASFSRFGCFVFEIWVLRTSVFVFECFVFETTHLLVRFNTWTSQRLLNWSPIPKLTIVLIWKTPACLKIW